MEYTNKAFYDSQQFSSEEIIQQDDEAFLVYFNNKMEHYDTNINTNYLNIKRVLNSLEEDYPMIDITNFYDFLSICEEYNSIFKDTKYILERAKQTHFQNQKLNKKIEKNTQKKLNYKFSNNNLTEELKFKEFHIKKLEEDLANTNKEYLEAIGEVSKIQNQLKIQNNKNQYIDKTNTLTLNHDFSVEISKLKEERQHLLRENELLVRSLEILKNDIKLKYIPKQETEKKLSSLEIELKGTLSRFRQSEANVDKLRRQVKNLKINNDELIKDLEESEKKLENYQSGSKRDDYEDPFHRELGLNTIWDDEEDDTKIYSKLRRKDTNKDILNQSEQDPDYNTNKKAMYTTNATILEENDDKLSVNSIHSSKYKTLLNQEDYLNTSKCSDFKDENAKLQIEITSNEIVNKMSNNEFLYIENNKKESNKLININIKNININKRNNTQKTTLLKSDKGNPENIYKDFFLLTFQSFKLNSENIEPFLYLNSEKLYKISIEKCIPFHKFYEFINGEITKCKEKIYSKSTYLENKYRAVVDFISSRLF